MLVLDTIFVLERNSRVFLSHQYVKGGFSNHKNYALQSLISTWRLIDGAELKLRYTYKAAKPFKPKRKFFFGQIQRHTVLCYCVQWFYMCEKWHVFSPVLYASCFSVFHNVWLSHCAVAFVVLFSLFLFTLNTQTWHQWQVEIWYFAFSDWKRKDMHNSTPW